MIRGFRTLAFPVSLVAIAILGAAVSHRDTGAEKALALAAILQDRAIDLTYAFDEQTIYWPLDEPFKHERTRWGKAEGGWYASAVYGGSEHGGTHMDSPIHFAEGQITIERIPLRRLIGPAAVVDITEACSKNRDYELRVQDLSTWEVLHGRIPQGAIVLVRTGFGKFWPDKEAYLGTAKAGDVEGLHFPGIGPEAARWLVSEREISGAGIDTASLDHGPSRDFQTHRILNGAGLFGLENVAELHRLPAVGAVVMALPMKIGDGSGAPTRIVALLPSESGRE